MTTIFEKSYFSCHRSDRLKIINSRIVSTLFLHILFYINVRWKREQNVSVEEGQQWCCCFWRGTREEHLERQPFNPSVSITRIPDSWRNNAAWNCLVWINFVRRHVNTHARAIGAWIRNLIWMPALRLEGLLRRYSCGLNVRATWNFPHPPSRKLLYRTSIYRVSRAPCN